jgi:S-adenosylmethionine:diacylglycerol 3-amino-3-carboxypropyl transferase
MIWYSHINEDSSVERKLLEQEHYNTISCVSGSGERMIALLDYPAEKFYAIDVNKEALLLLQLKLQALKTLAVEEYLTFIGHQPAEKKKRIALYTSFKNELNYECRTYWDDHLRSIGNGILNIGHFEKYLALLRPALHFILGTGFDHVFKDGDDSSPDFPKRRWQFLTMLFSNRWVYKLSGNRDPAFTASGAKNNKISEGLQYILKEKAVKESYIFHLIFRGTLNTISEDHLPVSLRKKHLTRVQHKLNNGTCVEYLHQNYSEAITHRSFPISNVFHSLSDIIGFESRDYMKELVGLILNRSGNQAVIRSFLINNIGYEFFEFAGVHHSAWQDLTGFEKSRMYQVFSAKSKS